nr:rod shape-determining protein MreC [Pleionea sediminis]
MFVDQTSNLSRLLFAIVLSAIFMFADHRGQHLDSVRNLLSTFLTPLVYIADLPSELAFWSGERIRSRDELFSENQALKDEVFILRTQLQKLVSLKAENAQLRNLLGTEQKVEGRRLVAEIVNVAGDPSAHELLINKGTAHDVFVGQAVLDAYGVMGQVTEASALTSRVLLITDPRHAIPVRVERSGERSVALGEGRFDFISLQYVRNTADIQVGDLLLSSGIGERFPDGYPVATVIKVTQNPGEPYARVEASTEAHLARTGQVLLIWPDKEFQTERENVELRQEQSRQPESDNDKETLR